MLPLSQVKKCVAVPPNLSEVSPPSRLSLSTGATSAAARLTIPFRTRTKKEKRPTTNDSSFHLFRPGEGKRKRTARCCYTQIETLCIVPDDGQCIILHTHLCMAPLISVPAQHQCGRTNSTLPASCEYSSISPPAHRLPSILFFGCLHLPHLFAFQWRPTPPSDDNNTDNDSVVDQTSREEGRTPPQRFPHPTTKLKFELFHTTDRDRPIDDIGRGYREWS